MRTQFHPTMNLRFLYWSPGKPDTVLQQRWDASEYIEGKWITKSEWRNVEHVER